MSEHTAEDPRKGIVSERSPADFGTEFLLGFDSEGYERREVVSATCACPRCGKEIALVATTEAWTERDDGRWEHEDYGCGVAFHCDLLIVDSFEGIECYAL